MVITDFLRKSSFIIIAFISINCTKSNFRINNNKLNNNMITSIYQNDDTIFSKDFNLFEFKEIECINSIEKNNVFLKNIKDNDGLKIIVVNNGKEYSYKFIKKENFYINTKDVNDSGFITRTYTVLSKKNIYKFFLHKLPSKKYFSLSKFEKIDTIKDLKQLVTIKKIFEEIEVKDMNHLLDYIEIDKNKYESEIYEYRFDYKNEVVKQYLIDNGVEEYYYTFRIGNSKSIGSPLYDFWIKI